jgi:hypothetical protein
MEDNLDKEKGGREELTAMASSAEEERNES